jgi:uncharacterized protein (DUF433 family)
LNHAFQLRANRFAGIRIVRDSDHSDGAPTVRATGIRVKDVASAYEHSGYSPDEITQLYLDLTLGGVHRALAYDDSGD